MVYKQKPRHLRCTRPNRSQNLTRISPLGEAWFKVTTRCIMEEMVLELRFIGE